MVMADVGWSRTTPASADAAVQVDIGGYGEDIRERFTATDFVEDHHCKLTKNTAELHAAFAASHVCKARPDHSHGLSVLAPISN